LASGLEKIHAWSPIYDGYWATAVLPVLQSGRRPPIVEGVAQFAALTAAELYQIGVDVYRLSDYPRAVKGFSAAVGNRPNDPDALETWPRSLARDSASAQGQESRTVVRLAP
jgi:hypothetical protein